EDIVVVDCGIAFAGPEYPGIDALIPDVRYLEERKNNIRGMIFTHGHEDHIGAVPYIWPKLGCPMYATPLAGGLIQHKLTEAGITNAPMTVVQAGDKLHFGKISVEMVRLTHSIPDVLGLAIRCPAGLFFYATDWRLEHTPALGKPADWTRIAQLAGEGITALFSDSTNVDRPGYSPTERIIGEAFDRIFQDAKARIIIAQFASNINRVQQVFNSAKKFGRKIALSGRSMETYVNIAMGLGYLKVPEGMLIDLRKVNTFDPHKVAILSTGSQGEEFSSLVRMSEGAHRHVKLHPTDTVVVSASAIPGNEDQVERLLTNLYREGVNVINNKLVADVHVSGHPSRDELKMMIALAQPQHFIPIHGSYPRMVDHGNIAVEMGVEPDKIIMMENGQIVEFDEKGGRISAERIPMEDVMIDGKKIGDVGPIVIRDRKTLGDEGMVTFFIVAKQKTGEMLTSPDIITRGFVYIREAEQLMHQLREEVKRSYLAAQKRHSGSMEDLKAAMRDDIAKFLEEETGRNPMIIPVITTV
ncbi:MAG TPA: ribonuclease J, partial [Patescibacteria group bacterium]